MLLRILNNEYPPLKKKRMKQHYTMIVGATQIPLLDIILSQVIHSHILITCLPQFNLCYPTISFWVVKGYVSNNFLHHSSCFPYDSRPLAAPQFSLAHRYQKTCESPSSLFVFLNCSITLPFLSPNVFVRILFLHM